MARELTSGALVRIHRIRLSRPVNARRRPARLRDSAEDRVEDNVITTIPEGAIALYMSSYNDGLAEAIAKKGRGPYGYAPTKVTYHLVLWGERPVWVSSEDAELEEVK